MLHSTRVVLVMPEAYYQSEGETQGQRSQSVVRTMPANTTSEKYFGNDCRFGNCSAASRWKSGHSWPRCGNAKECRPLGPGACRAKAGGDILNPLRGSKEPLFHICAGAEGVIRNDHSANPEGSRVSPIRGIADQICGRAAIHGRVERDYRAFRR